MERSRGRPGRHGRSRAKQAMTTVDEVAPAEPLWVDVTRGDLVESRHQVSAAVVDADGRVVLRAGDIGAVIYPRSAIKPIQALVLVESGAAEAFGVNDAEVALACASHAGEPRHVAAVAAWLERIGRTPDDLECGTHLPYNWQATTELLRSGQAPSLLQNNCSGKHTGFLTLAVHQGWHTGGYIDYAHQVQQHVLGVMESMCGLDLGQAPWGIDGCGIPTLGVPLGNVALAMARLAVPDDQPERRQAACTRVRQAMTAEPFMIAGSERFCTRVIETTAGRALVKTGAEGVYAATFPELGLGAALKVEDGAGRGSEVAMGYLLRRLNVIGEAEAAALADLLEPPVTNRAGRVVGRLRVANDDAAG
jgi:L-asparaginase II